MLKSRQTTTINPAALTEELHALGDRIPQIDRTIGLIEPEITIAQALQDDQRLAVTQNRLAQLRGERDKIAARQSELVEMMQRSLTQELNLWQSEKWDPAIAEIQSDRAHRIEVVAQAGRQFVEGLVSLRGHPGEVAQLVSGLIGERAVIEARYGAVECEPFTLALPAERELTGGEFAAAVEQLWKWIDEDARRGLPPAANVGITRLSINQDARFFYR